MPPMPAVITPAMNAQVRAALRARGDKRSPNAIADRHKRSIVTAHFTRNIKNSRASHNMRATVLSAWFPGINEIPLADA